MFACCHFLLVAMDKKLPLLCCFVSHCSSLDQRKTTLQCNRQDNVRPTKLTTQSKQSLLPPQTHSTSSHPSHHSFTTTDTMSSIIIMATTQQCTTTGITVDYQSTTISTNYITTRHTTATTYVTTCTQEGVLGDTLHHGNGKSCNQC